MALACSKLNAFQIFWGSYGKVNRRSFFDKDLFRPFTDMPEEAKEMLDRYITVLPKQITGSRVLIHNSDNLDDIDA